MNYGSEIQLPTRQINNSVLSIVPSQQYETTLQAIQPYEQQREQAISGLTKEYDFHTQEVVQTMEQTEVVNETRRHLKHAQGQNSGIKTKIQEETKQLDKAKHELQVQLSKQKIVYDLFIVFGVTIVVYLMFSSSPYVHMIALVVLTVGVVYVLQYNAYRISLFSDDDTSIFLGGNFDPKSIHETGNKWWNDAGSLNVDTKSLRETGSSWWNSASTLKAPNVDTKSLKETGSSWWNSASTLKAPNVDTKSLKDTGSSWWNSASTTANSLKPTTTPSFDISKWTSTTTAR